MRIVLPKIAAVKRGAGPNSPRLTADVSSVSTQPAPISTSACRVEVGSATRCSRFTPRRISARVASIGTPEDSRGTTIIAPSGMVATASSTEDTIRGISLILQVRAWRTSNDEAGTQYLRPSFEGSRCALSPEGCSRSCSAASLLHLPLDIILLHHRPPELALCG